MEEGHTPHLDPIYVYVISYNISQLSLKLRKDNDKKNAIWRQ